MSLITIFLIVVGIILVLFILNNYMITECFQDINPENIRKNAYKHIESIKDNYEKLKVFYKNEKADINGILEAKKYIKDAINNIDILLLNSYDRYKLSDIYHNELIPILDKPKDLIFLLCFFRPIETPEIVPPVPEAQINPSTSPLVCVQISSAVVSI